MSHRSQYARAPGQDVFVSFTPFSVLLSPMTLPQLAFFCPPPYLHVPLPKTTSGESAGIASPPSVPLTVRTQKSLDLKGGLELFFFNNVYAVCLSVPLFNLRDE